MKGIDERPRLPRRLRALVLFLRLMGLLDLCALAAVFAPQSWIDLGHRWCGMGEFPAAPIAGYLARSASAMYALHGATLLYLATDVVRYWRAIRFLACAALVHGAVMYVIDGSEGLPLWWRWAEGPLFAATGVVALLLLGRRPPVGA